MLEFLNGNWLLRLFLACPFIFTLLFLFGGFFKNHIIARRITKAFFLTNFAVSTILLFFYSGRTFSIGGCGFNYDRISSIIIFLMSIVFLLAVYISKSLITKLYKIFYSSAIVACALLNIAFMSDNIFCFLISLFWLMCLSYFLSNCFAFKKEIKIVNSWFVLEIMGLLAAIFLIGYDFMRFFVLNEIEFNFSQLSQYLFHINDISISLAFFGFLIIVFKLLNFFPFSAKPSALAKKVSPFVLSLDTIASTALGGFLFIKCYNSFDYLMYQYQDYICIYLIFNLIYFSILSLGKDDVIKFTLNTLPVSLICVLFSIFCFEETGIASFVYGLITIIVSYSLLFFIFCTLSQKFKTTQVSEFKKIKNRLYKLFITISLLNLAKTPFLAMFSSYLISFMIIFSTNYDSNILNKAPYCLISAAFIISLSCFDMLYKILIDPKETPKNNISLANHQIISFSILSILIIILGISVQYVFEQFGINLNIGNF